MTKEPHINVGIMSDKSIRFRLNGDFTYTNTGDTLSGEHEVAFSEGKLLFLGEKHDSLRFIPKTDQTSFDLKDVTIGKKFHWEQKQEQRFLGELRFITEEEEVTAINTLSIETYLTSVISSEMSATSSLELLKAHAVISRSWLLSQLNQKGKCHCCHSSKPVETETERIRWYDREDHTNFDVCADDHCQRYQGITKVSTQAVVAAINETRGEALVYGDEICDARFSKSCGGVAEVFENCWEETPHPYLAKVIDNATESDGNATDLTIEENAEKWIRTAPDAFCNTTDRAVLSQVLNDYDQKTPDFYRWTVEYTQSQLTDLVIRRTGIDFGKITDLIPIERGVSGRLIKLKIVGEKRTVTIGKELEIRKSLSESHLYSSAFVVDKESNQEGEILFKLTGAGWGHGVGLCQIGAAVMASEGYNYRAILEHYYKKAEIKKLY
ncbi:MAG: SpoIID/LytB domain-containing protein [Paludibacteraceae bacterium]|nr:SpoIID/LytB domain-containing protein [Paludibacteraceae bacterium]